MSWHSDSMIFNLVLYQLNRWKLFRINFVKQMVNIMFYAIVGFIKLFFFYLSFISVAIACLCDNHNNIAIGNLWDLNHEAGPFQRKIWKKIIWTRPVSQKQYRFWTGLIKIIQDRFWTCFIKTRQVLDQFHKKQDRFWMGFIK